MPMTYSEDERASIKTRVLDGLAKGTPLAVLCRETGMPDPATVWRWSEEDGDFAQAIARGRELGFDMIAAKCIEIADDVEEDPASRRVRTDVRLKLLAKWDPKRYGDKTLIGSDPENPLPAGFDVRLLRTGGDAKG